MEKYGEKFLVSKQVVFVLGLLAVVSCVVTGLIVYYAGVAALDKGSDGEVVAPTTGHSESQVVPAAPQKVMDVRLPRHLTPELYKVQLIPFIVPDNFTIKGSVKITMMCNSASNNITVHSADIDIHGDTLAVMDVTTGNKVAVSRHRFDLDREFLIVDLGQDLQSGHRYELEMKFTAYLKDNLKGFYKSVYMNRETGEEEYLAVTQFQATDARRAFPCFDEPALKAEFEVSLGRTKDMTSIGNMPISKEGVPVEEDSNYVWDHYQRSVKMSTYLVAFVVSKFHFRENTRENNVRFRIWSDSSKMDQTEYAREIGPQILEFFEEYFKVKFPLPKQDMIAIPDFGAGAMENWGLITYRETALLFKKGVSTASNKQRIAIVISHELAHQWFGNLVTPSWWTDLWLNEGFASYVEYLGVEAAQPDLKLLEQFIVHDLQDVLRIDALETSHPISIPVNHPDEISEIFDRISYGKGASIIRMMDKFLTTPTFRQGLTNYLNELKFSAAEQDDLWRHLTQQGHRDGTLPEGMSVKEVMDSWTLQTGFPVITVNRKYDQQGSADISQERFLLKKAEDSSSWWVPITFTYPGGDFNNTYNNIWMEKGQRQKRITGLPEPSTPAIFNVQQTGYYRVNYDEKNWNLISAALKKNHLEINTINRAQILDDALNLAKVGRLSYSVALSLTGYLDQETDYIPWVSALSGLSYVRKMLRSTPAYGEFKRYMLKLLEPIYEKVGFEAKSTDSHLDILLRKKIVTWACVMGNKDCLKRAKQQFSAWMQEENPDMEQYNPIDVNIKSETYCNAIQQGDDLEWDFAWERYKNSNVASEKSMILSALGCTQEIWLLNRYLNMSLTPESGVRKQDGSSVIGSVASNSVGSFLAFDFLRENWPKINDYWGGSSFTLAGIMKRVLADKNTQFHLQELKNFETAHKSELGTSTRAVSQAIESAEANVEWMENYYQSVWSWLKESNQ